MKVVSDDTPCIDAFRDCDFRFRGRNGLSRFDIGGSAGRAFTPRIVSKDDDEEIGIIRDDDIRVEFIDDDGDARLITNFGSERFERNHFRPFRIRDTPYSGIGHRRFEGNQRSVAEDRCIRIFFTSYQDRERDEGDRRVDITIAQARRRNRCVVFRTRED